VTLFGVNRAMQYWCALGRLAQEDRLKYREIREDAPDPFGAVPGRALPGNYRIVVGLSIL
jgi:hypothetical protein